MFENEWMLGLTEQEQEKKVNNCENVAAAGRINK